MPSLPKKHGATQSRKSRWNESKTDRTTTGRPWRRLREQILRRDKYLCQPCLAAGRVTEAREVDHILPVAKGGSDKQDNLQAICIRCHRRKTVLEGDGFSMRPEWLPAPGCQTVVVTGPPGGGKTTWCRAQAGPDDVVIDMDDCYQEVCGTHGHDADRKHLPAAVRLRNHKIAQLQHKTTGTAYLIVSEPRAGRVKWWLDKLKAKHVLMDPGLDVCLHRVTGRRAEHAVRWYSARNYTQALGRNTTIGGD